MKARNLLLFVLVAILGNACSSQDAQDLPTLSGEVIQDYLCIVSTWSAVRAVPPVATVLVMPAWWAVMTSV